MNGIANDAFGNTYFGGYYDCNPFIVGSDTLYRGTGYGNIFIAKVSLDCVPTPTCVASISDSLFNISPLNWGILPHYPSQVTNAVWYWGDGTFTIGLYPSHTYTVGGWYNICATVYTSCGDSANICNNDSIYKISSNNSMINVNVVSNTTDIHTALNNNSLSVYPNPTNGAFQITSNTTDKLSVELYDVNGRHVFSNVVVGTADINANSLDNGIYTLTIKNGYSTTNKKLVVAR